MIYLYAYSLEFNLCIGNAPAIKGVFSALKILLKNFKKKKEAMGAPRQNQNHKRLNLDVMQPKIGHAGIKYFNQSPAAADIDTLLWPDPSLLRHDTSVFHFFFPGVLPYPVPIGAGTNLRSLSPFQSYFVSFFTRER